MFGALTDSVDSGGACLEAVVHNDPAIDLYARGNSKLCVWANSDSDNYKIRFDPLPVAKLNRFSFAFPHNAYRLRVEEDTHALPFDCALEHPRRTWIKLTLHQPVHQVD